ncbi:MAG: RNA polymerase subunit sigma-70 [Planctomycetes bacterium]|nr:RNA polymerase subunit sigma-70 [Planctomycetota bacterium]
MEKGGPPITELLNRAGKGEKDARDALFPLVQDQMHRLAERFFRAERGDHTLQATALVHDTYQQLVEGELSWSGRREFYAIAAAAMRQLLAAHARRRSRDRRGGRRRRLSLSSVKIATEPDELDPVELSEVLGRLRERWPRMADIVEQRFFCGLSVSETSEVLDLGLSTVEKDWRFARAWLRKALDSGDAR